MIKTIKHAALRIYAPIVAVAAFLTAAIGTFTALSAIAIVSILMLPLSAQADDDDKDIDPAAIIITMSEAVEIAKQQVEGTALEVEIENEDDTLVWEVAILDDQNNVSEIIVEASTGSVLSVESDSDD